MNGKYIRQMGASGRGPDEYQGILSFCIDPDKKEIYLLDYWKSRLLKYRIEDGKLLDKIKLSNEISYSGIVFVEGCIYACISYDNYEDNDNLLLKIDLSTGEFKEYLSAKEVFNTNSNIQDRCFIVGNPPKFSRWYANMLFSCDKDSIYPYIALKSKDWVKGSDVYDDSMRDFIENDHAYIISSNKYYENDTCVHFDYRKGKNSYHIVYNKQTGATHHYQSIVNDINYNGKDSKLNDCYNIMSINSKFAYDMMFSELTLDFLRDGKFSPDLTKQLELLNLDEEGYVILEYEFK